MATISQYNPAAVSVSVGGKLIANPGETIATIDGADDDSETVYGADGSALVVANSNMGLVVKLSVQQNTPGNATLFELRLRQKLKGANGEALPMLAVVIYDSISKTTYRGNGIFKSGPSAVMEKTGNAREYTLELPYGLRSSVELAS